MTRTVLAVAAGIFVFLSAGSTNANALYVPGEVIVKFRPGAIRTRALMTQMYQSLNVMSVRKVAPGTDRLILAETVKVEDAIADLRKYDQVEYAQPNYILTIAPVALPHPTEDTPCIFPGIPFPPGCHDGGTPPTDPGTPPAGTRPALAPAPADVSPAVADPDLSKAYGIAKIGAPLAWGTFSGSKTFIVADIDTGIDYNHEDLAFNVWRNPNPTQSDVVGFDFIHNDGLPYDDQGHGTHTAGTIGATGGNGKGVSGVTQKVSIMSVKFLSAEGSGTTADAIKGIDYAIQHGAKVLSNSWGGTGDDGNQALFDSIERAKAADVLFIAAAGNDGVDNDTSDKRSYPAAFNNDNLIAVAATDSSDSLAYFSNFGKKSVHLAAPGVNVYSSTPGNKYKSESGTSMACPHVAGAAALIWARNPNWKYTQVKQALLESVDQISELSSKTVTGGRLNVNKALKYQQ